MSGNEDQDQNDQDTCEGRFIATVSSSSRSRNLRTQDLPVYTASCLSNLLARRLIVSTCFEVCAGLLDVIFEDCERLLIHAISIVKWEPDYTSCCSSMVICCIVSGCLANRCRVRRAREADDLINATPSGHQSVSTSSLGGRNGCK
jgi:hypothetical protein